MTIPVAYQMLRKGAPSIVMQSITVERTHSAICQIVTNLSEVSKTALASSFSKRLPSLSVQVFVRVVSEKKLQAPTHMMNWIT